MNRNEQNITQYLVWRTQEIAYDISYRSTILAQGNLKFLSFSFFFQKECVRCTHMWQRSKVQFIYSFSFRMNIQDALACTICFENYNTGTRQPHLLKCFHTFCQECLQRLVTPSASISCPLCSSTTPCSSAPSLPINYALKVPFLTYFYFWLVFFFFFCFLQIFAKALTMRDLKLKLLHS